MNPFVVGLVKISLNKFPNPNTFSKHLKKNWIPNVDVSLPSSVKLQQVHLGGRYSLSFWHYFQGVRVSRRPVFMWECVFRPASHSLIRMSCQIAALLFLTNSAVQYRHQLKERGEIIGEIIITWWHIASDSSIDERHRLIRHHVSNVWGSCADAAFFQGFYSISSIFLTEAICWDRIVTGRDGKWL